MEIQDSRKTVLYFLFATSGFCALVYEILWTKYLSLTFGTTMLAVSMVAATFMGGLALGSFLIGRYADKEANLLRIYAHLELGIAVSAILCPLLLQLIDKLHCTQHLVLPNGAISHLAHFLLAAIVFLPPTIFMGGTFPLMCRFFARKKSGGQIGRLYALNTLGATAGAFLAGFVLIPTFGLTTTCFFAAGLNMGIFIVTRRFAMEFGSTLPRDISLAKRPEQLLLAREHRLILVAIGLIGFFSLSYEILWTRVFLLFLGNTTYAFSLMLSAYLVAIAIGGAIYAAKVHPQLNEKRVFVKLTALMGLSIVVTAPFYDQLANFFLFIHMVSGERWWILSMLSFCLVFLVMFIPTILSGSLLPATVAILDPGKVRTGEGVGLAVLYNTVGAVLGSLIAGFLLIPAFGLLGSFRFLAALNILLAVLMFIIFRKKIGHDFKIPAAAVVGLALLLIPTSWNEKLLNSGVYCYAPRLLALGGVEKALIKEKILQVIEGRDTTVAVKQNIETGTVYFAVNGKTDGGTGSDMPTQILVGQIPMLLHPDPQEVLVIGYGSGITVGGVITHPSKVIDCAEISPEVVKASSYFEHVNGRPLRDPRVNLYIEDGRNLLLQRENKYDVIVSEPSNPWQTGNANLFTIDFYRLAASRLNNGGILCQWIGLYDITPENLQVAVNTYMQVFPHVRVFKVAADLVMIGSFEEVSFDYLDLQRRMSRPGLKENLASVGIDSPADLISRHYFISDLTLRRFSQGARLNTDDRPILEYSAQHNLGEKMFGQSQTQNVMALTRHSAGEPLPLINLGATKADMVGVLRELGKAFYRADKKEEASYFMQKARDYELEVASGRNTPQNEEG